MKQLVLTVMAGVLCAGAAARADDTAFQLKVYGFARLDAAWYSGPLFSSAVPFFAATDAESKDGEWTIHPRWTRIGLKALPWKVAEDVDVSAVIEVDFLNGGSESRPIPRLLHGYGTVRWRTLEFLGGQTSDLVSPLIPSGLETSIMWNSGNLGDRRAQARLTWTPTLSPGVTLRVALAAGMTGAVDGQDLDADGRLDGLASQAPDIQGLVEVAFPISDREAKIGVAGRYAREKATLPGVSDTVFHSWLASAHLDIPVIEQLRLRGEVFYGQDLDDVRGGIHQGVNASTGQEIHSVGAWVEAMVTLGFYKLQLGVSMDDPLDDDVPAAGRLRNRALWVGNTFQVVGPFSVGVGYTLWHTLYKAAPEGLVHRAHFFSTVSF